MYNQALNYHIFCRGKNESFLHRLYSWIKNVFVLLAEKYSFADVSIFVASKKIFQSQYREALTVSIW